MSKLFASGRRNVALAVVLALGLLEIGARRSFSGPLHIIKPSADPELVYELIPGAYVSDGFLFHTKTVQYEIAADQCRSSAAPEPTAVSPDVVLLGGSVAFGLDADVGDTVGSRMQDALRQETGRALEVETCAVPGHRFAQSLRMTGLQALTRHPPVIAVIVMKEHLKTAVDWTRMSPSDPVTDFLTSRIRIARVAYMFGYLHLIKGEQFEAASREQSQASLTQSMDRLAEAVKGSGSRVIFFLEDELKHSTMDIERELAARGFGAHRFQRLPNFETAPELWADPTHWSGRGATAIARQLVGAVGQALPSNEAQVRGKR